MGKAFAALVRVLALLALAGGVIYNYYEISRLRVEVAALRAGMHTVAKMPNSGGMSGVAGTKPEPVTGTMTSVQKHAERASEFLRKQDYDAAKRELEQAAASMRQAGSDARSQTAHTIDQLRRTVNNLSEKAEQMTGSAKRVLNGKQSEKID